VLTRLRLRLQEKKKRTGIILVQEKKKRTGIILVQGQGKRVRTAQPPLAAGVTP